MVNFILCIFYHNKNEQTRGNALCQSALWSCYELEARFRAGRHGGWEADHLLGAPLCAPSNVAASLSQALPEYQEAFDFLHLSKLQGGELN